MPDVIQHLNQLGHLGGREYAQRPLRIHVREGRLEQTGTIHHAVLGQLLNDQVDELDLIGRGGGATHQFAEGLHGSFTVQANQ